jgi:hypothetical protein
MSYNLTARAQKLQKNCTKICTKICTKFHTTRKVSLTKNTKFRHYEKHNFLRKHDFPNVRK